MGETFVANDEYESAFTMTGLSGYSSIMEYASGEPLVESRTSSTFLVTLADGRRICLKRYYYPKVILRYAVRRSRAAVEWDNLGILGDIGLLTPDPVAWGELREGPVLKGCFIATAYLDGFMDLEAYSREEFAARGAADDETILVITRSLALLAKKMHEARFVNRAFYFRNLLLDKSDLDKEHIDFHIIDSPKGYRTTSAIRLKKGRMEDLAQLYTDFARYFNREQWDTFVSEYFGTDELSPSELAFIDDVTGRSVTIARVREKHDSAHAPREDEADG